MRCIIDDKTSFSVRDIHVNVSLIAYAIISALVGKSKANKIIYAYSVYLTQYLRAYSSIFSKIYMCSFNFAHVVCSLSFICVSLINFTGPGVA